MTSAERSAGRPGCCHIVAAGPQQPPLSIEPHDGDLVIAADGGMLLCERCGIVPDLLVGDFDSLAREHADIAGCEVVELPRAKDDTDTVAAIREGLARGYAEFRIHAAFGGDVGHEMANLQALALCREHGADARACGNGQTAFVVVPADGLRSFRLAAGTRVSVFAFDGTARGVTERGLRWELEDAVLDPAWPLGVSNEACREDVTLGVREGALLVVVGP